MLMFILGVVVVSIISLPIGVILILKAEKYSFSTAITVASSLMLLPFFGTVLSVALMFPKVKKLAIDFIVESMAEKRNLSTSQKEKVRVYFMSRNVGIGFFFYTLKKTLNVREFLLYNFELADVLENKTVSKNTRSVKAPKPVLAKQENLTTLAIGNYVSDWLSEQPELTT